MTSITIGDTVKVKILKLDNERCEEVLVPTPEWMYDKCVGVVTEIIRPTSAVGNSHYCVETSKKSMDKYRTGIGNLWVDHDSVEKVE